MAKDASFDIVSEFDNNADFATYANEHLTNGVNGNVYTWDVHSDGGTYANRVRCRFPESITTMADEIEIPLSLLYVSGDKNMPMHLMNGSHVTQPWNNTLNSPEANMHVNSLYHTCRQLVVDVKGTKYAYVYNNRTNEFPVLTRISKCYDVALRGYTDTQNDVSGASWQETLGFRRVIAITRYMSNLTQLVLASTLDSTHKFALFSYAPVE